MKLSSLIALPILLIEIPAGAVAAQADCPCSGTAAQSVCFTRSSSATIATNGSNKRVRVVLNGIKDLPNDANTVTTNIPPGSKTTWQSGLNFLSCTADY